MCKVRVELFEAWRSRGCCEWRVVYVYGLCWRGMGYRISKNNNEPKIKESKAFETWTVDRGPWTHPGSTLASLDHAFSPCRRRRIEAEPSEPSELLPVLSTTLSTDPRTSSRRLDPQAYRPLQSK